MKELIEIQGALKAPKSQFNSFGKYQYRSCEDILEALKPFAKAQGCFVTLADEIVLIGDRYYVRATATIQNSEGAQVSVTAWAREAEEKAGMDKSQITGSASSYARKYALSGLFAIDDNEDDDNEDANGAWAGLKEKAAKCATVTDIEKFYHDNKSAVADQKPLIKICADRKAEIVKELSQCL